MKKMLRFVKKLIRKEVPELPKGYVRQNKIYGFEVARSNCGQICWIPSGKTHEGHTVHGFWKELDGLYVVEMDGKNHRMTLEEFNRYQAFLNE